MTRFDDDVVRYRFTAAVDAPADPEQRKGSLWTESLSAAAALMDGPVVPESGRRRLAAQDHVRRVGTAGFFHRGVVALDPTRCTFTSGRVSLSGDVSDSSPALASAVVLELLEWTLRQVYGAEADARRRVALTGLELTLREHQPGLAGS